MEGNVDEAIMEGNDDESVMEGNVDESVMEGDGRRGLLTSSPTVALLIVAYPRP